MIFGDAQKFTRQNPRAQQAEDRHNQHFWPTSQNCTAAATWPENQQQLGPLDGPWCLDDAGSRRVEANLPWPRLFHKVLRKDRAHRLMLEIHQLHNSWGTRKCPPCSHLQMLRGPVLLPEKHLPGCEIRKGFRKGLRNFRIWPLERFGDSTPSATNKTTTFKNILQLGLFFTFFQSQKSPLDTAKSLDRPQPTSSDHSYDLFCSGFRINPHCRLWVEAMSKVY